MTGEPEELSRRLQNLAARVWTDQRRATERYTELMERTLRGDVDAREVGAELLRFGGEEGAGYTLEAAQLTLDYYEALLDLGRSYGERFYERALRERSNETGGGAGERAPPRQIEMELRGEIGQEAWGAFVIENKRNRTAHVSFVVSDFVDAAGGDAFRPPLVLEPSWLTLGPNEQAEVRLRLHLFEEMFTSGHRYRTHIFVHGRDELELIVTVRVDAPAEPATRVTVVPASEEGVRARREAATAETGPKKAKKSSGGARATTRSKRKRKAPGGGGGEP